MAQPLEVWMVFHVVAATEEAAQESLDEHVEKLKGERSVMEAEADIEEVEEVEKPHPQLEKGYSQVCEMELTVKSFSDLVELVVNYGPTSVDVTAPESVTMELGEVRDSLNTVAQMMHQFLQAGAGGMMISRDQ